MPLHQVVFTSYEDTTKKWCCWRHLCVLRVSQHIAPHIYPTGLRYWSKLAVLLSLVTTDCRQTSQRFARHFFHSAARFQLRCWNKLNMLLSLVATNYRLALAVVCAISNLTNINQFQGTEEIVPVFGALFTTNGTFCCAVDLPTSEDNYWGEALWNYWRLWKLQCCCKIAD